MAANDQPSRAGSVPGTDAADRAAEAEWGARPLDPRDYSRRTHLANERTFLAWWRTGLTALAAALGAARVVPELADAQERWPYTVLGALCAVAGVVAIAAGHHRRAAVEAGLTRGEFPPMGRALTVLVTTLGVAIGVGTLLLVLLET